MKKYIIALSLIFLFIGCAQKSKFNDSIVRQSEAIFINQKPKDNKVYTNFTNSSNFDINLTEVLNDKLVKNGYQIVSDKKLASTFIKGNLNYFRKNKILDNGPTFGFGIGRGRGSWGYGIGMENSNDDYVYDAQVSLKISINSGKKVESYITNLDYQNTKGYNSVKKIKDDFDEQISEQIIRYFKDNE